MVALKELISDLDDAEIVAPASAGGDGEGVTITGITVDSRAVEPGFLFAAMPGHTVDGARFIPQAVEAGAGAVLMGRDGALDDGVAPINIPIVRTDNPRLALSHLAARFYHRQPEQSVAVTGTNGKTSIASFVRQICIEIGRNAASLGTVGLVARDYDVHSELTTPEPVALHAMLHEASERGVTHLAVEASSHGLAQRRLHGVRLKAGAFSNITRDHLDYHEDFDAYLWEKLRLFSEVLPSDAVAVINADSPEAPRVMDVARRRGQSVMLVGDQRHAAERAGFSANDNSDRPAIRDEDLDIVIETVERSELGQRMELRHASGRYTVDLPLIGDFQASNAIMSAGLCLAVGEPPDKVFAALSALRGASGRIEMVGATDAGAQIVVDYAHTPDALENVLKALRPYARGRLICVFGCGGDRDAGKRPLMGQVADARADVVIITDDNPRSEDPVLIRAAIKEGAPGAHVVADRAEAIRSAIMQADAGDVVLIAGKGHETGQIIGNDVLPFSDQETVRDVLNRQEQAS